MQSTKHWSFWELIFSLNKILCHPRKIYNSVIKQNHRIPSYFQFIIEGPKRNKRQRMLKGQSKMDNPEILATWGTQDEEKQNKNTTQYVLETTMRKQTQIK